MGSQMKVRLWLMGALLLMVTGCAVRLGGMKPVEYRALAFSTGSATATEVAGWIREAQANVVLLAAPGDSAWFDEVAQRSSLSLSGPGRAGNLSLAFLATKPIGDTTLVLPLPNGGGLSVHDALYKVDKTRFLDLLALRIEPGTDAREAVRALLAYVATDVMPNAAVVLAIDMPDEATDRSVTSLLSPAFADARTCVDRDATPTAGTGMRLFYGPEARLSCESAQVLGGARGTLVARLIVAR